MASTEMLIEEAELGVAIESAEFNLIRVLSPRISIDGDKWSVVYGENMQDGVCGFGTSPIKAMYDFNKAWHKNLPQASIAKEGL